jgi:hypothetical protein
MQAIYNILKLQIRKETYLEEFMPVPTLLYEYTAPIKRSKTLVKFEVRKRNFQSVSIDVLRYVKL